VVEGGDVRRVFLLDVVIVAAAVMVTVLRLI
jgi:hypothetical protein